MGHTEPSKLAELRARTDRQLVTLIDRRLESGIEAARRLTDRDPRAGFHAGAEAHAHAEKAYEEALLLLPTVDESVEPSRGRLRARLAQLRRLLDQVARGAVHAACL